jgi:retron-type reverse transcriptase
MVRRCSCQYENLAVLQRELLDGSYQPLPLRVVQIPKKSGGNRTLRIPSVRDRVSQQAVLRIIGTRWEREFEDSSYAYRKGRSVKQAISTVKRLHNQGGQWVLRADIEDYFENIPHSNLLARFSKTIPDSQLNDIIRRWLTAPQVIEKSDGKGIPASWRIRGFEGEELGQE